MSKTATHKVRKQSIEAQFALAERVIRNLHQSIDEQIERAQDLEVQRAMALYKSGKATLRDWKQMMAKARRIVG